MAPLFSKRLDKGLNATITSVVRRSEVLVRPLAVERLDLVQRYKDLLTHGPHLAVADITRTIAEPAAELRARPGIRLPDAW